MIPTVPLQSSSPGLFAGIAAILVGILILVWFGRKSVSRLLAMMQTKQSDVADVEPGKVEVEGKVVSAGKTVEERHHGNTDSDSVVSQYRQDGGPGDGNEDFDIPIPQQFAPDMASNENAVPFYVEDDTGKILVDPARADVSLDSDYSRHNEVTDRTRVQAALDVGETVYVIGDAVQASSYDRKSVKRGGLLRTLLRFFRGLGTGRTTADEVADDDELVITRTSSSSEFLISDTGETRGKLRMGLMVTFWGLVGFGLIGGGGYLVFTGIVG